MVEIDKFRQQFVLVCRTGTNYTRVMQGRTALVTPVPSLISWKQRILTTHTICGIDSPNPPHIGCHQGPAP